MGGAKRSLGLIRRAAMPALALIVVGNFAGYAVAGPNGLLAWGGYHRALNEPQAALARTRTQRAPLRGGRGRGCSVRQRAARLGRLSPPFQRAPGRAGADREAARAIAAPLVA